ncbi:MAG: hypothetical protein [Bacteriophage sp.]|nr:MAG: hypothetical protein [Bacteriophage sp.]
MKVFDYYRHNDHLIRVHGDDHFRDITPQVYTSELFKSAALKREWKEWGDVQNDGWEYIGSFELSADTDEFMKMYTTFKAPVKRTSYAPQEAISAACEYVRKGGNIAVAAARFNVGVRTLYRYKADLA